MQLLVREDEGNSREKEKEKETSTLIACRGWYMSAPVDWVLWGEGMGLDGFIRSFG